MTQAQRAIVLFAHGSRDPLWHKPIEAVADEVRRLRADLPVRCAYLELSAPDLPAVCAELAGSGIAQIEILPLFLGVGRHAREDLPRLVAALQSEYPAIHFLLRPSVGEHPALIGLLAQLACAPY